MKVLAFPILLSPSSPQISPTGLESEREKRGGGLEEREGKGVYLQMTNIKAITTSTLKCFKHWKSITLMCLKGVRPFKSIVHSWSRVVWKSFERNESLVNVGACQYAFWWILVCLICVFLPVMEPCSVFLYYDWKWKKCCNKKLTHSDLGVQLQWFWMVSSALLPFTLSVWSARSYISSCILAGYPSVSSLGTVNYLYSVHKHLHSYTNVRFRKQKQS